MKPDHLTRNLRIAFLSGTVIGFLITLLVVRLSEGAFDPTTMTFEALVWIFITFVIEQLLDLWERGKAQDILERVSMAAPFITSADRELIDRFVQIAAAYGDLQPGLRQEKRTPFYQLCNERIEKRLLRPLDWEDLSRGYIHYDNPDDEYGVAAFLIKNAEKTIDAISKTVEDLAYLQSADGRSSLEVQARLVKELRVTIRRLFVCNPERRYAAIEGDVTEVADTSDGKRDLWCEMICVARQQEERGVQVRILVASDGFSYGAVPDMNIIDAKVMRTASPVMSDEMNPYMKGEVWDLTNPRVEYRIQIQAEQEFERYWKRGEDIDTLERKQKISCSMTCETCPRRSPTAASSAPNSPVRDSSSTAGWAKWSFVRRFVHRVGTR